MAGKKVAAPPSFCPGSGGPKAVAPDTRQPLRQHPGDRRTGVNDSQQGPERISQEQELSVVDAGRSGSVICSSQVCPFCSHQLGIIPTKVVGVRSEPGEKEFQI